MKTKTPRIPKKPKICYLCAKPDARTRDHVIPKNLFDSPLPENVITAPACHDCNGSLSKDEEFFRILVLSGHHENPLARKLWIEKVRPSLAASPKFRRLLASKAKKQPLYSEGGIYLGEVPVFYADEGRINAVLNKIVRGLFYHHKRSILQGVKLFPFLNPQKMDDSMLELWRSTPRTDIGNGVFSYWRGFAEEDPRQSIWWLLFYGKILFIVITLPENELGDARFPSGFNHSTA